MAIDDHEVDDGFVDNDGEDWAGEDRQTEIVTVRFSVEADEARGRVTQDVWGKSRTKIVFVSRSWVGPRPTHGEEIRVVVVHETKAEDPRRGVLFVERDLPIIRKGGQCGKCASCGQWVVPLFDTTPIKGTHMVRARVRKLSNCKACGTLHRIQL